MISEAQLKEIEAREQATSKGPWVLADEPDEEWGDWRVYRGNALLAEFAHADTNEQDTENATFFAHAKTDIPLLIAEVRRLRVELSRTRGLLTKDRGLCL